MNSGGSKAGGGKWSARALLRRVLREPLTHFLGISTILFFGLAAAERPVDSIGIDRAGLIQFMQERARIFDEATFTALYDRLTPAERAELVHEYAMSEALYRTAEASSLEQADPLIRQRMIQQMRLLLQDQASSQLEIGEDDVRAYFEQNRQDYAQPATLTFTHVFVDRRKHGSDTDRIALELLGTLRRENVKFEQAGGFGDLFPYRRNYLDVSRQQVGSEFGEAVAGRLFSPRAATGEWQGPFPSGLGDHLVLISNRQAGRLPELAEVMDRVRDDALFARRQLETAKVADRLLSEFRLDLADDVGDVAEPAP
jgi:hypothetical protein